jgi:nicotinate phosphoribosyltransferase
MPSAAHEETLFTDLYELTLLRSYFEHNMRENAVFEAFARKLPPSRGFLMAAGLEQVASFALGLRFTEEELAYLADRSDVSAAFVDRLRELRFTGDLDAIPEGTLIFENEPLVRVTAPLPEAQLLETRLLNLVHFQTLVASKAARAVLVAGGKRLVDYGARRAHGVEAGLLAARAAYIAGFDGTATVVAGKRFGVPLYGTMAHSFIQAHEDELQALRRFAVGHPNDAVLLIDTYDTEAGARKVVELAREGLTIRGVRIDSGDLLAHARKVRRILDDGGLEECTIFASGGLDENEIQALVAAKAPIDGFGVGTRLDTSADAPYLDCAYKLEEYAGRPRRKRSEGKATWPGSKQVFRLRDAAGVITKDTVTLANDEGPGEPLLVPILRRGRRIAEPETLDVIRRRAARELRSLPAHLRRLEVTPAYPVVIGESLARLAATLDAAGG